MPAKKRDYAAEYRNYQGTPEQRKRNDSRKKARRMLEKEGLVKKGDKRDVDHKNGNPLDSRRSNLQVLSRSKNRAKH